MKTTKMNLIKQVFMCFIITVISGICYAKEVSLPGSEYAGKGWKMIAPGVEGKQLKFTSKKMVIDGKDVTIWDYLEDDAEEPYSYTDDLDSDAHVGMKCEGEQNSDQITAFDFDGKTPPTKTCSTGKGVGLNFYAPHNENKDKCTYVADIEEIEPPAAVVPVV